MISLTTLFTILILHWIADFILQTDKQAKGKSHDNKQLLSHTITYSVVMASSVLFLFDVNLWQFLGFGIITFIAHTITDYYTSRLNSKLWAKGDTHNFFVSVGFDQVLHYVQLFLTYYILFK